MKVAIFARIINEKWAKRVFSIIDALSKRGFSLVYYRPFYNELCSYGTNSVPQGPLFSKGDELPSDIELFLCFGGDGTLLESITILGEREIPVIGINFGRLGFLTTVDSNLGDEWMDRLISRDYIIKERELLKVETSQMPKDFSQFALNEVSFQRRDPSMMSTHVTINGLELPPYWSDGIVLATPTGSTAYSLSVGGPIALPGVKAIILAPIAPHNLNVRPLVISDDAVIEVFIESRLGEAILSLDNRAFRISAGVKVKVTKADLTLKYLSFDNESFIQALREKLMWGADRRNV